MTTMALVGCFRLVPSANGPSFNTADGWWIHRATRYDATHRAWSAPITASVMRDVDEGWGQSHPDTYETITTGNVDGRPGDEVIGPWSVRDRGLDVRRNRAHPRRLQPGHDHDGRRGLEPSGALAPRAGFSDAEGWNEPENALTVQPADVLPGEGTEVVGRADGGVITYALQEGAWVLQPGVIWQFSDANGWGSFAPPAPSAGSPCPVPADVRYSTIKAATVMDGQPQVIIGRDVTGLRTFTADGSSPSAPFAPYTHPTGAESPRKRAWAYVNAAAAREFWPLDPSQPTIRQQYSNVNQSQNWSALQADLIAAHSVIGNGSPSDPGQPGLNAMNITRSEYNAVLQDVSDWTGSMNELYSDILGPTGKKQLVEPSFVTNATTQVNDIKAAFDANEALWVLLADLVAGLIGAATIFTGGLAAPAAAAINAVLALVGSGAATGISSFDPNGAVNTEADALKDKILEAFCSGSLFLDNSFNQIVQDYGLLTASRAMIEKTSASAPSFDTLLAMMTNGQALWIWQQFGNKNTWSNLWIGWCDFGENGGAGCPWGHGDQYTWNAPENPDVSYRLVGEFVGSQGTEANCDYNVFANEDNGASPSLLPQRRHEPVRVAAQLDRAAPDRHRWPGQALSGAR